MSNNLFCGKSIYLTTCYVLTYKFCIRKGKEKSFTLAIIIFKRLLLTRWKKRRNLRSFSLFENWEIARPDAEKICKYDNFFLQEKNNLQQQTLLQKKLLSTWMKKSFFIANAVSWVRLFFSTTVVTSTEAAITLLNSPNTHNDYKVLQPRYLKPNPVLATFNRLASSLSYILTHFVVINKVPKW